MSPYRPDPWPRRADSPLDRARTVARSYREALLRASPETCLGIDVRFIELGQTWIAPDIAQYEPDDLLTPRQAAMFCHVRPATLPVWRRRGLRVTTTPDGLRYRVADLLEYQAGQRRRRLQGHQSTGTS